MMAVPAENALLKAYQEQQIELLIQRLKVACVLAISIVPVAILLDIVYYAQHLPAFLLNRLLCVLVVGVILLSLYKEFARRYAPAIAQVLANTVLGYNAVMIFLSDGVMSPYYAGLNLVVLGLCLLVPWSFKENLAVCLASLGWYFGACALNWMVFRSPDASADWFKVFFNNTFIMLSNVAICGTAGYYAAELRFRDFRLQYELDQSKRALEASYLELDQNKKALEESYRKLKELDQAKSHFFANLSHELRTPLTLILSPLDNLRGRAAVASDGKMRETLDLMYENGLRLLALINDLLDLVRLEQGRLELHFETIDLKKFLPGILSSVRGVAERCGHVLESDVAGACLMVKGDKDRLEKIFLNLLFNAIKFTPKGGRIWVNAWEENGLVLVEVRDTGIGIAKENLGAVFERFWQEDGSPTRSKQGTGIGLALVKELVELHHGRVSVRSEQGVGSTFRVELPKSDNLPASEPGAKSEDGWLGELYRKAQYSHVETASAEAASDAADSQARGGRRHTLLLIEDDADMQRFLTAELGDTYQMVLASDGQRGWDLAHERQPKLILTDLMLPKIDGITLCRQLRASPSLLPTKIILLTARADDRTKLAALEAGADDFLVKPFSIVELKTRLANLLLTGQLERELQTQNQMLESTLKQLQTAETQLIQNARLSALGSLSAGIMHEINNPVNFMITAVHYLKSILPADAGDAREAANDIQEGLKRIRDIIADLKEFAYGGPAPVRKECDPRKIVRTAKRLLASEISESVRLEENVDDRVAFCGNEGQLAQLLVNLLQNALHATAGNAKAGRERLVRISVQADAKNSLLAVWDNGTGIKEDHLPKIFDPFFTTKQVGEGTGLGLSICHTIVKQHGGDIFVRSELDRFTEFTVRLPLATPALDRLSERSENVSS